MWLLWHTRPEHMNLKLRDKRESLLLGQGSFAKVSKAHHASRVSSPL